VFAGGSKCGPGPDAPKRATVVRYFCDAAGADGDRGGDAEGHVSMFRSIHAFEEVAECLCVSRGPRSLALAPVARSAAFVVAPTLFLRSCNAGDTL
jgi:hypothetical protein